MRWIGDQHVREDLGFIPSFAEWVRAIRPEPWTGSARPLEERLQSAEPRLNPTPDGPDADLRTCRARLQE